MHILITDDEKNALNILNETVKEVVPYADVHDFDNPIEALEFMKKTKCEIAFLDIQMREMSGTELARKLKEIHPKVNIVFVTGYSEYTSEAFSMHASGYVYKPVTAAKIEDQMENLRFPLNWKGKGIYIKTFGNFELIVDDEIVTFSRSKSKEALAYLVDRKGQNVTRRELARALFEDDSFSKNIQTYLSKIVKDLLLTLKKAGAESILKRGLNTLAVNPDAFDCDYYNYEKKDASAEDINRFQGEYMNQYSWGENTLALLYFKNGDKFQD